MSANIESPTLPLPPPRSVKVTVPAAVAYDLDKAQTVTAEILRRVGCPGCHSGIQILFALEEEYFANAAGQVRAAGE